MTPTFSSPDNQSNAFAVATMSELEDDIALMRRVVARDDEAFNTLYARYTPRLRGYLMRFLGQSALVEEVLNDVMFVVWQRAAHFDFTLALVPWLFGIARQKARKALARFSSTTTLTTNHDDLDSDTPEQKMLRKEYAELLEDTLNTLPLTQRTVLALLVYQGCSYQEIAERTGHPVNTIKTRVFRARCSLAARLATLEHRNTMHTKD